MAKRGYYFTAILDCINSAMDRAGNCYWAFRWTDCKTGNQAFGTVTGGESNINAIKFEMNGGNWEPHDVYYTRHEYGWREFCNLTKEWPHAGCDPKELAKFVRETLKAKARKGKNAA